MAVEEKECQENKIIYCLDTDDKINLFKEKFKLNIKYPVKDKWYFNTSEFIKIYENK